MRAETHRLYRVTISDESERDLCALKLIDGALGDAEPGELIGWGLHFGEGCV